MTRHIIDLLSENECFELLREIRRIVIRIIPIIRLRIYEKRKLRKIKDRLKEKRFLRVGFVLQYPEMWNSVKSVYEEMMGDDRFQVDVIAISKPKNLDGGIKEWESVNDAVLFCKTNNMNYRIYEEEFEIESYDVIFIQRPYDEIMPDDMSMKRLSRKVILCYIPYGFEFGSDVHFQIEYNRNMLNAVMYCFTDSEIAYDYVCKRSSLEMCIGARKVYDLGYPRFDLIKKRIEPISNGKNALWIPRWSANTENDRSFFLDYYDILFEFYSYHQDYKLVIRPHPQMFTNFLKNGILSEDEISNIKSSVEKSKNIFWDNNYNYLASFEQSDMLIADFSSLLIEYFIMLKPIIYCGGNTENYNLIGKEMAKGFYNVNSKEELLQAIEYLANNEDEHFMNNRAFAEKYVGREYNAGAKIKEALYCSLK